MDEKRTEQGVILRSALDAVKRQAHEAGRQNAVAAVVTKDGAGLGYARLSEDGRWALDVSLRAQWEAGKVRDVRAELAWSW